MENLWNLFVGDLEYTVQDSDLWEIFSHFNSLVSARVLRDPVSEKSKGYGFVSFTQESDAVAALTEMDKKIFRNREIRVNWAVQKVSQKSAISYEEVSQSTPIQYSTVYIGNLPTSESLFDKLLEILKVYGYVIDLKIYKGFAFAK